jgi:hypothetical protein
MTEFKGINHEGHKGSRRKANTTVCVEVSQRTAESAQTKEHDFALIFLREPLCPSWLMLF